MVSIYAIGSLLPDSNSNNGRKFSFKAKFLDLNIENTEAESVEAIVEANNKATGNDRAKPTHDENR